MSGYDLQELPGSLVLMTSLQKLDLSLVSDHIVSIDRVADPIDDEDLEMLRKTSNHIRPDQEWEHALSKNNYAGKMLVCISPSKGLDKNRMAEFKNKKPQKSLKRNQKALHLQLSRRQEAMRKVYSPNSPTYALSANDPLSPRSNSMLHLAVYSRNNIPFPVLEKQTFAPNVNILTALRFSENLVQLSLAHHLFTDSHLMHHIFSENLTSLDLSFNCITPEGAMHIANNLTWLKELNLSHNKIKNRAGRAICEMPNLTRLELANTGIINETLYGLVQGQNDSAIEYLDISYNFLSPKSFSCEIVFRQLPNLKHLNARNSMFVNDYELIKSLPYAKQLRHLDVRENKLIGERAKRFLSRDLKQPLQVLY
jgi:Leucine-rich repeat (LRR) protein